MLQLSNQLAYRLKQNGIKVLAEVRLQANDPKRAIRTIKVFDEISLTLIKWASSSRKAPNLDMDSVGGNELSGFNLSDRGGIRAHVKLEKRGQRRGKGNFPLPLRVIPPSPFPPPLSCTCHARLDYKPLFRKWALGRLTQMIAPMYRLPFWFSQFNFHAYIIRLNQKTLSFQQDKGIHVILGMFSRDAVTRKMICEVIRRSIRNINTPPPPPSPPGQCPGHLSFSKIWTCSNYRPLGQNCVQIPHSSTGFDGQIPLLKIKCF